VVVSASWTGREWPAIDSDDELRAAGCAVQGAIDQKISYPRLGKARIVPNKCVIEVLLRSSLWAGVATDPHGWFVWLS
jgi:hypothetical protein